MLIDAHIIFARLAFLGRLLVGGGVHRAGIDRAFEQDRLAIGPPDRLARAGRDAGHAAGFTTGQVQHIDLRDIVALALGGKGDAAAVGRPGRIALARLGRGQAARRRRSVGRHDPQVADRAILLIGWFAQRIDHPFAVRARHRRADTLHHPQRFVGQHLLGLRDCRRGASARHHCRRQQQTGYHCHGIKPLF